MHIHVLGIGGTFMVGMARIALQLGHRVSGSDQALYPPMSTQLDALGVELDDGYHPSCLDREPDLVVIGNALSRGNSVVEAILERDIPYTSGPAWLESEVLHGRHVLAVSGTHGKTSVASLLTWMLEHGGLEPGFLVGGVLENFGVSARLGAGKCFVIEADEYDTAFFDKRSKFVHYRPRTLVINNLEFDHADIFNDLAAIQTQFHHVVRLVPAGGQIICPRPSATIDQVLEQGCWSPLSRFGTDDDCDWRFEWHSGQQRTITLQGPDHAAASATTPLLGEHNAWNVAAAACAAASVGVAPTTALASLAGFANVKRRLELLGEVNGIRVYDDFAHHPTAISATLDALRDAVGNARIIAVLEPRSNTMRMGVHRERLSAALQSADQSLVLVPENLDWDVAAAIGADEMTQCFSDSPSLLDHLVNHVRSGDHVLIMSNGAFDNIHQQLLDRLEPNE